MNITWNVVVEWIVSGFVQNFSWMIIAVFLVQFFQNKHDTWKYGKWQVHVLQHGKRLLERDISVRKAKEILTETSDLSVFVKGVTSPYARIYCDVVSEGVKLGLLVLDYGRRVVEINLDNNLSGSTTTAVCSTQAGDVWVI